VFSAVVRHHSISHLIRCHSHARNRHRPSPHRPPCITCARLTRCHVRTQTPRHPTLHPRQHTYRPCHSPNCWLRATILVTRAIVMGRMTTLPVTPGNLYPKRNRAGTLGQNQRIMSCSCQKRCDGAPSADTVKAVTICVCLAAMGLAGEQCWGTRKRP
jgi:hypothetical protein